MLRWAVLVCVVACSSPPAKPYIRPERHPPVEATSDRSHPQQITLGEHGFGNIRARANGPGTWWYSVDIPAREPNDEIQEWWTALSVSVSTRSKRISLQAIDEQGHVYTGITGDYGGAEIAIAETTTPPRSLLVGVTTIRAEDYRVNASVSPRGIRRPPPTPCDPLHIDPTNRECKGVYPPCNRVAPSLTNPNCCQALTCNLAAGCFARVISRISKLDIKVAIGTRDGIMVMAQGLVRQRGKHVATGHVIDVEEDALTFRLDSPEKLDDTILLSLQTQVQLTPPEWCHPARPIHKVEAARTP